MKTVQVTVISKAPPGGRCEIYDRFLFEIVKAYRNVHYCLIPSNLYGDDITPPAVLINGKLVEPEDGILLTPEELINALEGEGAEKREEAQRVSKILNSVYENFLGG